MRSKASTFTRWMRPDTNLQRLRRGCIRFKGSIPNLDTLTSCFVVVNVTFFCSSPQLGSESLHAGASCHRVRLHRGEFFILGTKSLMLIIKRSMFHSRQLAVTVPLHGSDLHKAGVTFPHWNVMFSLTYSHCRCIAFLFKPGGLDESGAARNSCTAGASLIKVGTSSTSVTR